MIQKIKEWICEAFNHDWKTEKDSSNTYGTHTFVCARCGKVVKMSDRR